MTTRTAATTALPLPSAELFTTTDLVGPDGDRSHVRRAVDRGEIVKICHGVYARRRPEDPVERHLQLVRAGLLRPHRSGAVGGISAALVHGLDVGWWTLPRPATFVRPGAGGNSSAEIEVLSTRLPDHHVQEVDGMPVCSVARAIVDVARRGNPWDDDLTAAVIADAAFRRSPDPGVLREQCDQVLEDLKGCSGLGTARRVISAATPLCAGAAETVSRVLVQRMGMPAPLLDVRYENDTDDDTLQSVRIPFSWPTLGVLGVVTDRAGRRAGVPCGWSGDRQAWQDGPRRWLREQGWTVVEWSREELGRPWAISRRLGSVIRELRGTVQLRDVGSPGILVAARAEPSEPAWDHPVAAWGMTADDAYGDWAQA